MSGGPDVIIIKKKPKGHAPHGAAWKVAYADFVTAMMALFMVLWLVSQTDQKLKKSLSDYFRTGVFSGAPSLLEGGSGVSDRGFVDTHDDEPAITPIVLERDAETLRGAITNAVNSSQEMKGLADMVTVKVTENGILLQIAEGRDDLIFDLSSSALKPALTQLLADLAPTLATLGYGLELHGHTDARPFPAGSGKSNWGLSFQRADAARTELEHNGVPPELILGVYAHGATQPMLPKDPKSPMNRRLAIFARRVTAPTNAKPVHSAPKGENAAQGAASDTDATSDEAPKGRPAASDDSPRSRPAPDVDAAKNRAAPKQREH